ncbi:hypothetical protein [Rhodocaloribacter sp.]
MRPERCAVILLAALSVLTWTPRAQAQGVGEAIGELARDGALFGLDAEALKERILRGILDHPETLNAFLRAYLEPRSRLLSDLNLSFKTFDVGGADSASGLGLAYDFARDLTHRRVAAQAGLGLSLAAEGNVAFERRINPADFLATTLAFHLYKSWGGTARARDPAYFDRLNALEDVWVRAEDEAARDAVRRTFTDLVRERLRDQLYLDFSLASSLEANQDFTVTQWVFGAGLGLDLKLWKNGYLNVFDWPAAAVRWLSGYDDALDPLGATFPTVVVSLERVAPGEDPARERLTGKLGGYTRAKVEVAFKTPVNADAYVEANFRHYAEVNAPAAVRRAGLHRATYLTLAFATAFGPYVSYTTGRLPFDAKDDRIYELGLRYRF